MMFDPFNADKPVDVPNVTEIFAGSYDPNPNVRMQSELQLRAVSHEWGRVDV